MGRKNLRDLWAENCVGSMPRLNIEGELICGKCGEKYIMFENGKRGFHPNTPALEAYLEDKNGI